MAPRTFWQCLETLWAVTTGGRLASSGSGMLLKVQRTAAHTQYNYLFPKANSAELRNPGLDMATTGCVLVLLSAREDSPEACDGTVSPQQEGLMSSFSG